VIRTVASASGALAADWNDSNRRVVVGQHLVAVVQRERSGQGTVFAAAVAYWAPFFLAPVVPGTEVDDPPYPVKRVAGVPVSLLGAAATTATAAARWFIDRRSTGFQAGGIRFGQRRAGAQNDAAHAPAGAHACPWQESGRQPQAQREPRR
jgi:hypothetical protein